jgi:hypothetical protein
MESASTFALKRAVSAALSASTRASSFAKEAADIIVATANKTTGAAKRRM